MIWALKKLQQRTFEGANKPGKHLAYQLKKKKERKLIIKLTEGQKEVMDEQGIENMFWKYSNLYKKESIDSEKMEEYMQKTQLRTVSETEREELDRTITAEEVATAIGSMNIGKAPGPDGFKTKFYRIFQKELVPKLQIVVNNVNPI